MSPDSCNPQVLPPEAAEHYRQIDEPGRLTVGANLLELVRTRQLLLRFLPKAPADILDVGGAGGIHALWLAEQGYQVDLVDAMAHHVEHARQASRASAHPLRSAAVGDARRLEAADASFDGVLLLGPLYHLTLRDDRVRALTEARRVLLPGGVVLAGAISRFASTLDGVFRDLLDDPHFVEIARQDVIDGQHRNPTGNPAYFTTTFFHHPDELASEIRDAGLRLEQMLAIEGPAWLIRDFPAHWSAPGRRERMLEALRWIESEPSMLGCSAHILAVARAG